MGSSCEREQKAKRDERYPYEVSLKLHRTVCCRASVITANEGKCSAPVVSATRRLWTNGLRLFISSWEDRPGREVKNVILESFVFWVSKE